MCRNGGICVISQCESVRKNAACLLTISDSFISKKQTTAEERQTAFINMMKIALETFQE